MYNRPSHLFADLAPVAGPRRPFISFPLFLLTLLLGKRRGSGRGDSRGFLPPSPPMGFCFLVHPIRRCLAVHSLYFTRASISLAHSIRLHAPQVFCFFIVAIEEAVRPKRPANSARIAVNSAQIVMQIAF
jgi:hypothetical protein